MHKECEKCILLYIFSNQFQLVKSTENKKVLSSQQKAPPTGLQGDVRKKIF